MQKKRYCFVACASVSMIMLLTGCNNGAESVQNAAATKTQPNVSANPTVPTEVKSQVAAATQKEQERMSEYSRQMSEQYKKNPPVIK